MGDRLSTTAGPPYTDENECFGDAETSSANGLHETPLAGAVPPLVDFVSPVEDDQSQNTQDNESNVEETRENLSNTGFFDPQQTTARRWASREKFPPANDDGSSQGNCWGICPPPPPPEVDACVAPILDKNILNYIPSNRKKFVEQRDRDLALVQRAMLNAAAPLCCLHDRLESNEDIPNNDLLCALQPSLCLLGSTNHITTTLRRKKITRADGSDTGVVDVVSLERHLHSSRTSARSTEFPGGQSIEDMHRLERLEAPTKTHQTVPGRHGRRPLCYEADAPVTTLCQLAPRSEIHRSRCIFSKLGHFEGLRLSPVQSNTTNSNQSSERQSHHCPSDPSVARADLVAFTSSTGNPSASSPTFNTRNTEEPRTSNSDACNVPTTASSRLACFERSCSTVGLPEHVTRLLSASVRKSTNKTYDSSWRKWNGWCHRRQIDPISAGFNNVLTSSVNNLKATCNIEQSMYSVPLFHLLINGLMGSQSVNTLWLSVSRKESLTNGHLDLVTPQRGIFLK